MTGNEVDRKPDGQVPARRKRRPRGRPKGHRISVHASEQITAICTRLGLTGPILTFRDLTQELTKRAGIKVGLGTVYRYVKDGIEPDRQELRALFKLPPKVMVTACSKCGIAHIAPCPRTSQRQQATYPNLFSWPIKALAKALRNRY